MYHYLPVELGLFYAYIANEFICHCLFQIAHLLSAAFFTATENIYFVLKRNTHNLPRTLNSQELFSILSAFKPILLPGRRFIPYFLGKITVSTVKTEYRCTPTFVNLKSNTMKNTLQRYGHLLNLQIIQRKRYVL